MYLIIIIILRMYFSFCMSKAIWAISKIEFDSSKKRSFGA